ncbi:hypothetical protein OESDEN_00040 [Oesophagostomum dentatum]|uniref:Uncharacterized protein n=1 Tax=Oesophagostomum dentatum TaxID=61180 RepID=A0A0B1TVP7_OESDE|nr:hypothetical protein OESDEN_00040 [Oesophagostomum dentatum]
MKLLAALLILVACIAAIVSSTPVRDGSTLIREKRQYGYGPYGPGGYYGGAYGRYGPGYPRRRGPTVIQKTVVIRPG